MKHIETNRKANGFSIEVATSTLDRTIEFIRNCENKTSIFIGVLGIGIAILLTDEGIKQIKQIIKQAIKAHQVQDVIYLAVLSTSILFLSLGIVFLVLVLVAKIDSSKYKQDWLEMDSKIYFGHISSNLSYQKYKIKLAKYSEQDHLNDLISQIYINSVMCAKKFQRYRGGFKFSLIGAGLFILAWVFGVVIY